MARGILTGVVHGALLSVVALAGLSLLAPLPRDRDRSQPVIVPDRDATPSGQMDLPVGSEFGRAGDLAPQAPAPIRSDDSNRVAEPVAVPAPRAEPAPTPVTDDNARPETLAGDRMPAQTQPAPLDPAPDLQLPGAAGDAPMARNLPGLAPDAPQDSLPQLSNGTAATEDAMDPAPRLPSPGLDLSLPPDLTDLRKMERN
ncbi:MAG: hypothetical protein L0G27_09605 [Paracoccus sp. (in: a-proteobacteria)]|nr:hypothetical protein [Paracoccus sp. (in: a-proteobacteria)]